MVQRLQGVADGSSEASFMPLDALVTQTLERVGPAERYRFAAVRRVGFARFKEEWRARWGRGTKLDALVVWTQIQSFIKGSIEAVAAKRPLLEEEYLALGEDRVRISAEQRREAHAVFRRYEVGGAWQAHSSSRRDANARVSDELRGCRECRDGARQVPGGTKGIGCWRCWTGWSERAGRRGGVASFTRCMSTRRRT